MEERVKSTHKVEVVPITLEKHPNADALSIVKVWGFTVVVKTADWIDKTMGAYIQPDSVVNTQREEFTFLKGHERIKVKKLRGIVSQGLLLPVPEGSKVGDDVAAILDVERYEPPTPLSSGGEDCPPPDGWKPCFDVESWNRYKHLFKEGEQVVATEKVHGASARYLFQDGIQYCGSRTGWKKEDEKNLWWKAFRNTPSIKAFCEANPGITLYGEVAGQVQDLKYGAKPGEVFFYAFDVWDKSNWLNFDEYLSLTNTWNVPRCPIIYTGPYSEEIQKLAEGKSIVAQAKNIDQIREGIVIRPAIEKTDPEVGRVCLKVVSNSYLERA